MAIVFFKKIKNIVDGSSKSLAEPREVENFLLNLVSAPGTKQMRICFFIMKLLSFSTSKLGNKKMRSDPLLLAPA